MERPTAIRRFEQFLLPALPIDLINNITSMHRVPNNPFEAPYWVLLLICAAPTLIGLGFWFFIARRGSQFARVLFVIVLTLGLLGFVTMLAEHGTTSRTLILAGLTELLKIGAMLCLFQPDAGPWFEKEADRPS